MKTRKAIIIIIVLLVNATVYIQGQNYDSLHKIVVTELQEKIPLLCKENNIPGFAIVVVDKNDTIWSGTYGYTGQTKNYPINRNTLFALMSCSKSITALGVLMAVQDGLLDLDEPISRYIPDFVINSRFDDNPESKITLRHLLSHKAGFENDAYLESFNWRPHEIEEYMGVASKSWMRFPVGYRDYYSNIGVELAAYILEKKTKMPFRDYMNNKVFNLLGMEKSTYDLRLVESLKNRALGNWANEDERDKQPPFYMPLLASGGSYSNILDMTKYLKFHINGGKINGKQILREDLMKLMHTITFPIKDQKEGYTIGMEKAPVQDTYYLMQEGGGYGFESSVLIYPKYDFGIVFFSNSCWTKLNGLTIGRMVQTILDSYFGEKLFNEEILSTNGYKKIDSKNTLLNSIMGFYSTDKKLYTSNDSCYFDLDGKTYPLTFYLNNNNELIARLGSFSEIRFLPALDRLPGNMLLINLKSGITSYYSYNKPLPEYDETGLDKPEWGKYKGKYNLFLGDVLRGQFDVTIENGYLTINNQRCFEHLPGLFFNSDGMAFDFREKIPTVATFPLRKEK